MGSDYLGKLYESRVGIASSVIKNQDLRTQKLKIKIYNETGKINDYNKY